MMVRIGHLSPTKTQEEMLRAFYQLVPDNFKLVHRTLNMGELVDSEITAALAKAQQEALELARFGVDIIVMGGTPTVLTAEGDFINDFTNAIQKEQQVAIGFSHLYQRRALFKMDISKPVVITPWGEGVGKGQNGRLDKDLHKHGINPAAVFGLNIPLRERGKLADNYLLEVVPSLLEEVQEDFDGLYIPCANWPVVPAIEELETRFQVPVVASTPAMVAGVMGDLALQQAIPGRGRLLRHIN